jgi:hypothetical protein
MPLAARTPTIVRLRLQRDPIERSDLAAIETITPGMIIEYHDNSGALTWGVHDSANGAVQRVVALDQSALNLGLADTYAAGDLVRAWYVQTGDQFYGLIPSGQSITQGAYLQSNGDGMLKALASGTGAFIAAETIGTVAATTRCRIEVV